MTNQFLATTAISEFWDKESDLLFLGSWCKRHDRPADWEGLKYTIMPSPWDNPQKAEGSFEYLDNFTEKLLTQLSQYLNTLHQTKYTVRYWRILIGPWLFHFVHSLYDRFIHLDAAFKNYPDLKTFRLDPASYRIPRDTLEYIYGSLDDLFNLQIYSQLMQAMGLDIPVRSVTEISQNFASLTPESVGFHKRGSWKARARITVETFLAKCLGNRWKVAFCQTIAPPRELWKLAWRMRPRALPYDIPAQWSFEVPSSQWNDARKNLSRLPSSNAFEKCLVQILPYFFPTLFIEGYVAAKADVLKRYPMTPEVIVSAMAWYYNEPFKFWAAEAAHRGTRLMTSQHGGSYGTAQFHLHEMHERRLGDSFATWGWASQMDRECQNLPNLKLLEMLHWKPQEMRGRNSKVILFVATDFARYVYAGTCSTTKIKAYLDAQIQFISTLPQRLQHELRYRPIPANFGVGIRERIAQAFPTLKWDDPRPYHKSLQSCRLAVADHCDTAALECLAANIPTVLYLSPAVNSIRSEAVPYFDLLRSVKILHDSPEAASIKVAEIFDDPGAWWYSPTVQTARKEFVDHFVLLRTDWMDLWTNALNKEIAAVRTQGSLS